MNQWGHPPMGKDLRTLAFGIVIIAIIGVGLFKTNYFSIDATATATPTNVNSPSTIIP